MTYSFCLAKGCRNLNHSRKLSSSQCRGSLSALYVEISMASHRYAGNNQSLWTFLPRLLVPHPGRRFKGRTFASATNITWCSDQTKRFFEEQNKCIGHMHQRSGGDSLHEPRVRPRRKSIPNSKTIQTTTVMLYTVQFNVLVMINYFGYESKVDLRVVGAAGLLEQLQLSPRAVAISQ